MLTSWLDDREESDTIGYFDIKGVAIARAEEILNKRNKTFTKNSWSDKEVEWRFNGGGIWLGQVRMDQLNIPYYLE